MRDWTLFEPLLRVLLAVGIDINELCQTLLSKASWETAENKEA